MKKSLIIDTYNILNNNNKIFNEIDTINVYLNINVDDLNINLTNELENALEKIYRHDMKFDFIYVSDIFDRSQMNIICNYKEKLLNEDGLLLLNPNITNNYVFNKGVDDFIVIDIKKSFLYIDYLICSVSDAYSILNIDYKNDKEYEKLAREFAANHCNQYILTDIKDDDAIGFMAYDGLTKTMSVTEDIDKINNKYVADYIAKEIMKGNSLKLAFNNTLNEIIED